MRKKPFFISVNSKHLGKLANGIGKKFNESIILILRLRPTFMYIILEPEKIIGSGVINNNMLIYEV